MSRVKNCILAALATWMYYEKMIHTDLTTTIFAVTAMAISTLVLFEELDKVSGSIVMRKRSFKRYKKWFLRKLNAKRMLGYDENRLKSMVLSIITHQTKYAFSGKQIEELLECAKDDYVTNCSKCGKIVARKDVLVTVGGEMCEECLEVS